MKNTEITESNSVKERLIHFINSKGLSQAKFEKLAGLSNGYVNNIVKSISDKTFDYKISPSFPELSKLWVLHGQEPMILNFNTNNKLSKSNVEPIDIKNLPHAEQMEILHNKIINLEDQLKEERKENAENTKKIIDFIDEYMKPVFDFMQESMNNKKKDNVK